MRTLHSNAEACLDVILHSFRTHEPVVPIVGPELVTVAYEGRQIPLTEYLARRLAEQYRVAAPLPDPPRLSDVVAAYLQGSGRRVQVYRDIYALLQEELPLQPSPALLKLAEITHFRLFVTTTFDPLLVRALNETRFDGEARTREIVFTTKSAGSSDADLHAGWDVDPTPLVYYLCGRAVPMRQYVVTDEDTLEFMYSLAAPTTAERLFGELRESRLLVLGCGFPDWLSRFFLRIARRKSLSGEDVSVLVADRLNSADSSLAQFFERFCEEVEVYPGTATDLVDRLHERWLEQGGGESAARTRSARGNGGEVPDDAVFISYARDDLEQACLVYEGLQNAGIDVWMDRTLQPGDDYEMVIRHRISRCSLFVPVISRKAVALPGRWLYYEWNEADRTQKFKAPGAPFVVPVIIDDTPEGIAHVPESFWRRHAARLPGGRATPDFIASVREALMKVRGPKVSA